jgi:flagellar basal body-associated protein FliL
MTVIFRLSIVLFMILIAIMFVYSLSLSAEDGGGDNQRVKYAEDYKLDSNSSDTKNEEKSGGEKSTYDKMKPKYASDYGKEGVNPNAPARPGFRAITITRGDKTWVETFTDKAAFDARIAELKKEKDLMYQAQAELDKPVPLNSFKFPRWAMSLVIAILVLIGILYVARVVIQMTSKKNKVRADEQSGESPTDKQKSV